MNRTWLIGAVAVIIVGVAGFFAGQQVGGGGGSAGAVTVAALKATPSDELQTVLQQYFQENGGAGPRGSNGTGTGAAGTRPGGGGLVNGTVVAKDDTSITVKLTGGSTKNVLYSSSTTVSKSTSGKIGDVSTGATVVVTGSSNTDGSVTAQRIQIVPAGETAGMPGPPDGGAPAAGATATTTGS